MRKHPALVLVLVLLFCAGLSLAASASPAPEPGAPAHAAAGPLSLSVTPWHEPLCITWAQRYTIVVGNTGTSTLTNVVVRDVMPPKTYPFLERCSAGAQYDGASTVSWTFATLAPGESRTVYMELGTTSMFADYELLVNTVNVVADGAAQVSQSIANHMANCTTPTPSATPAPGPDIEIAIGQRANPLCAGWLQHYDINVRNSGGIPLTHVVVTDALPDGTYYRNASGGGSYNGAGLVTWSLGTLAPGETRSFYVEVGVFTSLPAGSVLTNTVEATSDQTAATEHTAGVSTNIIACAATTPTPGPGLTLINRPWYTTWCPGWVQHYDLVVTNNSGQTQTNVVLTDTIPPQTSFWEATGGGTFDGAQTVTWNLGSLADGASVTLRLSLKFKNDLTPGTIVTNRATLRSDQTQPITVNGVTTVRDCLVQTPTATPEPQRLLQVTQIDWHDPLCITWRQRYTIQVTNTSWITLTGVVVADTKPLGTYPFLYQSSPGATIDPGTGAIQWTIGDLSPQASVRLYLEFGTNTWLEEGWIITNTVHVSAQESLPAESTEQTTMTRQGICTVSTPSPTPTRVPPTATPTRTFTPPAPTATPTFTPEPPTATMTPEPTVTPTDTPEPPTPTPTPTEVTYGGTDPDGIHLPLIIRPPAY